MKRTKNKPHLITAMDKKQWKFTNERGRSHDNSTKWFVYVPNTEQDEELEETPNTTNGITYSTTPTCTIQIIQEGPHSPIFKPEPKKKTKSNLPKLQDSTGQYFDYFFSSEIPIPSFPYYSKSTLISSVVGSKSSINRPTNHKKKLQYYPNHFNTLAISQHNQL